jgi:single-stranded DNA-binding protein
MAEENCRRSPLVSSTRLSLTRGRRDGDRWVDGETSYFRCNAWRELAEHLAESLHKGDRVIVTGRLRSRTWETEGAERAAASRSRSTIWGRACGGRWPRSPGSDGAAHQGEKD